MNNQKIERTLEKINNLNNTTKTHTKTIYTALNTVFEKLNSLDYTPGEIITQETDFTYPGNGWGCECTLALCMRRSGEVLIARCGGGEIYNTIRLSAFETDRKELIAFTRALPAFLEKIEAHLTALSTSQTQIITEMEIQP